MNTVSTRSSSHGWGRAYVRFLRSRDENLFLKIAPVLLLIGSPEVVASNLIPVVGPALDLGTFSLTMVVLGLTVKAVRKYR